MAIAMALLMGVTSCKNSIEQESTETGELHLTMGFTVPTTKAGASTTKPVTSWDKSIKSLQLLLVDPATDVVRYAHTVNLASLTGSGLTRTTASIPSVPVGTWDLYLVANNNTATVTAMYANLMAGTDAPITAGTNITTALFKLKAGSDANAATGAVSYVQPTEIFVAKRAAVQIIADQVNTVTSGVDLTRITGLLRVRINKSHVDVRTVDFGHASASFRVRNVATGYNMKSAALSGVAANNTIFAVGAFRTLGNYTTLSTGGSPEYADSGANGMGVVADQSNVDDFTYWRDYLSFPGGSASGAGRFNIVVSGYAPAGYRTADGTLVAAGGGLVYWTGPVDAVLTANNILEMNVTLTTPGIGGPTVPPVGTFGNLTVTTNLIEWGPITSVNVGL